ncbi:hypothetical protein [Actinoplanes xinjiangensis]|uniref:hypothetical protein n=1 Tax=Actinoplanes xinjiangensis TaxID=512350 RepID=UPI0011B59E34|nr:hypothetical protein [Actinoplanes xinjiangensis]
MRRFVGVVAVLGFALSGCAATGEPDGPGDTPPSGVADPFTKVVAYAECLQKEGLPVQINPGDGYTMPLGTDRSKIAAAEAACRNVAPPGMYDKPSTEELDRYVKVAQCLRDKGIKVDDPTMERPQLQIDQQAPANLKELQADCEEKAGG